MTEGKRLVFGDPESIAIRNQGRAEALQAIVYCPWCLYDMPYGLVGPFFEGSDWAYWECLTCDSAFRTDLEGTRIHGSEKAP